MENSKSNAVALSQEFLLTQKNGTDSGSLLKRLVKIPGMDLFEDLQTDERKKAFWINIYNGYTQYFLKEGSRENSTAGLAFGSRRIVISGMKFSLDEIEHGILRRSKIRWGLGYLNKIWVSKRERALRVRKLDFRIHFALNCGAVSCPPIAFYEPEKIDNQLDFSTRFYLMGEVRYHKEEGEVLLPSIMNWYRGDFSGRKGIFDLLVKYELVPSRKMPRMKFSKYNWNLKPHHYLTLNQIK